MSTGAGTNEEWLMGRLEKVTAERDVALKHLRELRAWIVAHFGHEEAVPDNLRAVLEKGPR